MKLRALLALATLAALPALATPDDPALAPAELIRPADEAALPSPRDFQGIPGLAASPGGRLWAVWYGGGDDEGPHNYVMVARSDDGGRAWSGITEVIHHPHPNVRTYDPVPWTDPQGRLWIFYAQCYAWWDGRAGTWAVVSENPDAPAPVFSAPRRLCDGIMMNKPTVLADGRWLLPVAMWRGETKKDDPKRPDRHLPDQYNRYDPATVGTLVVVSKDQGQTFSTLATLPFPGADILYDEHMFIERADGTLWMLIRGRREMLESTSADGGLTWTPAAPAAIPHINARFFIRRLASGKLLLVRHRTPAETGIPRPRIDGKLQTDRAHLSAFLSTDDGRTWTGGLLIDERLEVSYPDGDQLPDGTIVITYDRARKTDREILFARFTEADIAADSWAAPDSLTRVIINRAPATP